MHNLQRLSNTLGLGLTIPDGFDETSDIPGDISEREQALLVLIALSQAGEDAPAVRTGTGSNELIRINDYFGLGLVIPSGPLPEISKGELDDLMTLALLKRGGASAPSSITGTITGPSDTAVVGEAAEFTVDADAYPVYAVLYVSGVEVGSRTLVSGDGTVNLTPTSAAPQRAVIWSAATGGSFIAETDLFTPEEGEGGGGGGFTNPRYFGVSALTSLNNSQLLALSTDLVQSKAKSATSFSPSSQYCYYAYPASFGLLTNISIDGDSLNALPDFGNFSGSSGTPEVMTVTPAGGSATSYNVYRSNNALAATFTLAFT